MGGSCMSTLCCGCFGKIKKEKKSKTEIEGVLKGTADDKPENTEVDGSHKDVDEENKAVLRPVDRQQCLKDTLDSAYEIGNKCYNEPEISLNLEEISSGNVDISKKVNHMLTSSSTDKVNQVIVARDDKCRRKTVFFSLSKPVVTHKIVQENQVKRESNGSKIDELNEKLKEMAFDIKPTIVYPSRNLSSKWSRHMASGRNQGMLTVTRPDTRDTQTPALPVDAHHTEELRMVQPMLDTRDRRFRPRAAKGCRKRTEGGG